MAISTVAIFDGHPSFNVVERYYDMFPNEMSDSKNQSLDVRQVVRVPRITFEKLLDAMIEQASRKFIRRDTFLVVAHGFHNSMDHAYGLTMPLTDNTTMKTVEDVLRPLVGFMNKGASETEMTDFEKDPDVQINGVTPKLPKGCVSRLVGKMKKLRDLKVRRVEFRACALGTNVNALEALGLCFSARFVYAPDVHMFYTRVTPGWPVQGATFDSSLKWRGDARVFDDGSTRLAIQVQGSGAARSTWAKTTAKDVGWFVDRYVWDPSTYPRGGSNPAAFYLAGMDLGGSKKYALPQEPEYAKHLIWRGPLPGNMI